jgi:hypothetical protein
MITLRHLRIQGNEEKPNPIKALLKINLDWIQECSGMSYPIFENTITPLPHLEGQWLPTLRDTLAAIDGKLIVDDLYIPQKQREGDEYIMDLVVKSKAFKPPELRGINYYRYFLGNVTTVSDISNAGGTRLVYGVYKGEVTPHLSRPKGLIPHQEKPGPTALAAWRKFLKIITFGPSGILRKPLGSWIVNNREARRRWPYMLSKDTACMYKSYSGQDYQILPCERNETYSFTASGTTSLLPLDSVPVDAIVHRSGWQSHRPMSILQNKSRTRVATSFENYIDTIPDYHQPYVFRHSLMGNDESEIIQHLSNLDKIILVSDGGAAEDYGCYGWVLSNTDGLRLATGMGPVFGNTPSSYRAEITGCKAGLLFIKYIRQFYNSAMFSGTLTFYCDNQAFIKKITKLRSYNIAVESCTLDSDWDLLHSVHLLMSEYTSLPHVHHVKGHQDKLKRYEDLDLPSQLNVDADRLATRAMHDFGDVKNRVPFDPCCHAQLELRGKTITKDYATAVSDALFLKATIHQCKKRFGWEESIFNLINWDSYSKVYSKYPITKTFFFKFGWYELPTGNKMSKRDSRHDDRCPTCREPKETDDHIFCCLHNDRVNWRRRLWAGIKLRLEPFLDPELLELLKRGLLSYFQKDTQIDFPFKKRTTRCTMISFPTANIVNLHRTNTPLDGTTFCAGKCRVIGPVYNRNTRPNAPKIKKQPSGTYG